MPYWYEWRDLNPQSIKRQILSLMCIPFHHTRINSIIHQTILQVNGGHSEIRTRTLSIMSWQHYLYAKCPCLVEDQGVEPCDHIPIIYSLANCCITVLPIFLIWHPMRESNSQPSVRSTVWYSFHQSGIGTSWQIRTADLLRVKETFYHWNNEAHNMEEGW